MKSISACSSWQATAHMQAGAHPSYALPRHTPDCSEEKLEDRSPPGARSRSTRGTPPGPYSWTNGAVGCALGKAAPMQIEKACGSPPALSLFSKKIVLSLFGCTQSGSPLYRRLDARAQSDHRSRGGDPRWRLKLRDVALLTSQTRSSAQLFFERCLGTPGAGSGRTRAPGPPKELDEQEPRKAEEAGYPARLVSGSFEPDSRRGLWRGVC